MARKFEGYKLKKYSWSPFWYVIGGKTRRVSTGTEDRQEAEEFRSKLISAINQEQAGTLSVAQALDDYMQEHAQHLPSAATTGYYSVPLLGYFGDMDADTIRPADVRGFIAKQRKKKLSDGTIRRQLTVLSASLNHARKEGRLSEVPHITMPSNAPAKERWLTPDEADKLIAAATQPHLKLFILIAIYTGQRKGAILDLRWEQVDFAAKRIDFNPVGRKQTAKRRSAVPIENEDLISTLKDARKNRCKYVISYHGKQVMDIKKGFAAVCEAAGLEDVTPHTLRHTCGTWLAQAGVDLWQIGGILGHSHTRTTELYLKHSPDYLRGAVQKIGVAHNLRIMDVDQSRKSQKLGEAR